MIRTLITMTIAVFAFGGAATAQDAATASASFVNAEGQPNGNAKITRVAAGGVLIKLEVTGLPVDRWVAVHVHETGSCDHTTKHQSAGGHFNPGSGKHGYMSANGPHAGDMPNQYVGSDGILRAEILNHMVSLDGGDTNIKGRALMVHAKRDDYKSQPSGDAGDRLGCAVIK